MTPSSKAKWGEKPSQQYSQEQRQVQSKARVKSTGMEWNETNLTLIIKCAFTSTTELKIQKHLSYISHERCQNLLASGRSACCYCTQLYFVLTALNTPAGRVPLRLPAQIWHIQTLCICMHICLHSCSKYTAYRLLIVFHPLTQPRNND